MNDQLDALAAFLDRHANDDGDWGYLFSSRQGFARAAAVLRAVDQSLAWIEEHPTAAAWGATTGIRAAINEATS